MKRNMQEAFAYFRRFFRVCLNSDKTERQTGRKDIIRKSVAKALVHVKGLTDVYLGRDSNGTCKMAVRRYVRAWCCILRAKIGARQGELCGIFPF
ncbi:MAG: hypothetical protein NC418_09940 [Muribaculaceae bacterium]|nr:hypothetical protein [Muribaculaceae bacterium]